MAKLTSAPVLVFLGAIAFVSSVSAQTLPEAQVRKMFGFPAAFVNGQMFSGLYDDYMFVRLSPEEMFAAHR